MVGVLYRESDISLLSVAGNVLGKIMLTRLLEYVVDLVLPGSGADAA